MNRGGTRIRRFVVETPVEESVSLHSEKVTLERRPVTDGRPGTDSFSDKTMEMTESAEEAVVSKTARVYEEVGLRKEATDRVETVRDTVRKAGGGDRAAPRHDDHQRHDRDQWHHDGPARAEDLSLPGPGSCPGPPLTPLGEHHVDNRL